MIEYAISACLAGSNVRYDGDNKANAICRKLYEEGRAILICPEVMGGLLVPRNPSEIVGDKVMSNIGKDVTAEFQNGAELALQLISKYSTIHTIILKDGSPSCGLYEIYDGTFSGNKVKGKGVFARSITDKYKVISEEEVMKITL